MKRSNKDEEGATLLIVVAVMGIVLFVMAFVFDLAKLYVNSIRLQNVVDSAVESGSGVLSEELLKIAEERQAQMPEEVTSEPLTLLTSEDRMKLLDERIIGSVKNEMQIAAQNNLVLSLPEAQDVEFSFLVPFKVFATECRDKSRFAIYAKATMPVKFWFKPFKKITGKTKTNISVDSISYVNLCY